VCCCFAAPFKLALATPSQFHLTLTTICVFASNVF
jgi:hypothetical protein